MSSLKNKAIAATIWTVVGYGGSQALRMLGNIILTRLLVPELFGLMALLNTFIMGLYLFSDVGIRPSIIRSQRGNDPLFLNTAWTIQVIRGWLLWLLSWIITIPIAKFYNEPKFLWLIPVIGFSTVISGFQSTSLATINRNMEIGKLTRFEFATQTISLVVMIIWAYLQKTIWALVGGNIISNCLKTIWSHSLDAKIVNRFAWDQDAFKELVSFGRWIFLSTAITFLASQADRLILGKLFSLEMLGIYTVAFTFADLARQLMQQISSKVMFPLISQYATLERTELREKILNKRFYLLSVILILIALLTSFGDFLILLLYDRRYQQAAWMLPILALGTWPSILSLTIDKALFAIGNPKFVALGTFVKFLYMIIALPLAFYKIGVSGAIIVIAFNDLPSYIVTNYGLWREKLAGIRQDIQATLLLIALTMVLVLIRHLLGWGSPLEQLYHP